MVYNFITPIVSRMASELSKSLTPADQTDIRKVKKALGDRYTDHEIDAFINFKKQSALPQSRIHRYRVRTKEADDFQDLDTEQSKLYDSTVTFIKHLDKSERRMLAGLLQNV